MTTLFSKRSCAPALGVALALALTAPDPIRGQLSETDFEQWTITQTIVPANPQGASVAGASEPEASGGRHFVARHTHSLTDGGAPLQIGSAILGPDDFDPTALGLDGITTFEVELGFDVDPGFNPNPVLTPKVDWRPVLEQDGVLYRPPFRLSDSVLVGEQRLLTYEVAQADWSFPAGIDLGPGAPRVRVGIEMSTQVSVLPSAPSIQARVTVDDFRLTVDGGVSFGFTTTDLSIPGETINFTVEVVNSGDTSASGLILLETVPERTTFVEAQSDPGWQCAPGPDAGSECRFQVGELARDSLMRMSFTVLLDTEAPESFEVWNELSLESDAAPAPALRQVSAGATPSSRSRVYDSSCSSINAGRLLVDFSRSSLVGCSKAEQVAAFGGACCIVFNFDEADLCEGTHCVVRCREESP